MSDAPAGGLRSTAGPTPPAERVLVVASELPPGPGGIGAHAHDLAIALAEQGRELRLLGSQHYVSDEERSRFNQSGPVPITTFVDRPDPVRTATARSRQFVRAIDDLQPDVVLASGGRVLWLAAIACGRRGVPFIAVVHGTELGGPAWQRALTRRALDRAAAIVAVSRFTASLVDDLGVERSRVEVVHNGADASRFGPDVERATAFRDRHGLGRRPLIVTVGNVTQRKGQHQVVAALPRIVGSSPDAQYVVVGRPTEGAELRRLARELGVQDHVHLLGQLPADEVEDAHRAADVFAMTSTNTGSGDVEGYGIAVVEAALSGVPAVVCRGTGAEEAVVDGVTGVTADPGPRSIADAVAGLLRDDGRRRELGRAAEERARREGTWTSRATAYGAVIDRVAGRGRPRIVVVSHTEHHRTTDGAIVGFGPTLRELDHLATLASELVHVAPLHDGPPPGMALPYAASNIRFVPAPTAGGPRAVDRLLALRVVPTWARIIDRELRPADVVHVRAPAGIAMVALLVLLVRRAPRDRWVKYAGNWSPEAPDAITYRIQRAWLRRGLARAAVTVNGRWPDQPPWIHAFDNPTLTESELADGAAAARRRPAGPPFRLLFLGRLEPGKGADVAAEVVELLHGRGLDVSLHLLGDGSERARIEARAARLPPGTLVTHGWVPRAEVEQHLTEAHVLLLPSRSEGFPKAVAEALAFGCVPVTTGVSSIGQVLDETGGAVVVEPGTSWADAVHDLLTGGSMGRLACEGVSHAPRFSYAAYLERVRRLARTSWGREL